MDKKFDDYECSVNWCRANLSESVCVLKVLYEGLEREGYQPEDSFNELMAIAFARRFNMYLAALNAITRQIQQIVTELSAAEDELYAKDAAPKN